ncbi:MAG TPA: hypothetical protein DDW65_16835, partial [Firmicutes bacterium]|nr:hypothetical protein [Bacillota bacterium]
KGDDPLGQQRHDHTHTEHHHENSYVEADESFVVIHDNLSDIASFIPNRFHGMTLYRGLFQDPFSAIPVFFLLLLVRLPIDNFKLWLCS